MSRLLIESVDGIDEYLHYDEAAETFAVQRVADVEALLDHNKALLTHNDGYSPSREWKRVASFPVSCEVLFTQMYGANPFEKGNEDLLKRILNDPDLKHFRTAEGAV